MLSEETEIRVEELTVIPVTGAYDRSRESLVFDEILSISIFGIVALRFKT